MAVGLLHIPLGIALLLLSNLDFTDKAKLFTTVLPQVGDYLLIEPTSKGIAT